MDNSHQKNYDLVPSSKKELINTSPLVSRGLDLAKNITDLAKYKASLLWVDDEENILSLVKQSLGKRGYKIATFTNGFDALEELKKNNYDLLVSDLIHPAMEPLEVVQKAKALKPRLNTMIVSGHAEEFEVYAKELGCVACISKPCTISQLEAAIEKVLKFKRGNNFV